MRSLIVALALVAAACQTETACTDIAVASVSLDVADTTGAAVTGATVTFTTDGGEPEDCEEIGDGAYVCGFEVAGALEVTVAKDGYAAQTESFDIASDECHVIGQTWDVTLALQEL